MKQLNYLSVTTSAMLMLVTTNLTMASESTEHVAPGYLSSGFGIPVKNNYGECWMSGPVPDFKPIADCMQHTEPAVAEAPAPVSEAAPPEPKQAEPEVVAAVPAAPIHMSLSADALFDFDKSKLRPAGMKAIEDALGKTLIEGGPLTVERILVVGHTDSVGTIPYNQKLSERRAHSVKMFMLSKGVQADMIVTEGRGKLDPIATNKTAEGRQLNRRVDITFEGTEPAQK